MFQGCRHAAPLFLHHRIVCAPQDQASDRHTDRGIIRAAAGQSNLRQRQPRIIPGRLVYQRAAEVALRAKRITLEESRTLLRNYEQGLAGYTYLERD